ncbi:MAG: FAD-dependent tricarballylate dehydrogenase TcuA, partial [SAR324 cluster bacterium]|nr:FAD-dependent tricarballylate dehydrogenase TcuA [SAR324 cluster bacterium]
MAAYDVIVVGAGNAAFAAAISAHGQGAQRVLVLEKAPEELRGGNTHYSGGLYRFAFDKAQDLLPLLPHIQEEMPEFMDSVMPYPQDLFRADLLRVTEGRTDPTLSGILIGRSYDTVCWLVEQGIEMEPSTSLSSIRYEGKVKWSPGAVVRARHEGVGLSKSWFSIAAGRGVEVRYETGASRLLQDGAGAVAGVVAQGPRGFEEIPAKAVVLGCGGFESNPAWRARYLGRPWDTARVRGTAFNNGDGLEMAFAIGAAAHGQYTGCHATPIDGDAPPYGDRELTDKTNRLSFPYSVMLNRQGQRFADEGEDFQLYTYAKMGGIILNQPGGIAWQIFDSRVVELLEPRYATGTPLVADTLEELAAQLPLDVEQAQRTLAGYNEAAARGSFDPTVLDGLRSDGLPIEKTNWARPLDTPPYYAYPATGGITFTFGGVLIN